MGMAQPSQPGASPERPAGTSVPPGPCTSEVSWCSCQAGCHLHTGTRMADGEGRALTAEPTCLVSALLCSANTFGVRWGTHRDQGLLGVRHQGCDRDVGGTSTQCTRGTPSPLSHTQPMAVLPVAVLVLEGGTSPVRCHWDTEVPTSGDVGYCGGHWPGVVGVGCPHGCCAQDPEPTQSVTVPLPRCSDLGGGAHPKVTHSKAMENTPRCHKNVVMELILR